MQWNTNCILQINWVCLNNDQISSLEFFFLRRFSQFSYAFNLDGVIETIAQLVHLVHFVSLFSTKPQPEQRQPDKNQYAK